MERVKMIDLIGQFITIFQIVYFVTAGKELTPQVSQQQLLSPLPFPTSLPLLAASVAGTKIITTDPVRHLEVSRDPRNFQSCSITLCLS